MERIGFGGRVPPIRPWLPGFWPGGIALCCTPDVEAAIVGKKIVTSCSRSSFPTVRTPNGGVVRNKILCSRAN
jgi:hypothetical protein